MTKSIKVKTMSLNGERLPENLDQAGRPQSMELKYIEDYSSLEAWLLISDSFV